LICLSVAPTSGSATALSQERLTLSAAPSVAELRSPAATALPDWVYTDPLAGGTPPRTAVYDISAHVVVLPDGTRLEAHSGLRERADDPRFVREHMRGPTPPALYELAPRKAPFHGVAALRLKPVFGDIFGRTGLLTHTYMLHGRPESNGCVVFRDYASFLRAFRDGSVKRLRVVPSVGEAALRVASRSIEQPLLSGTIAEAGQSMDPL